MYTWENGEEEEVFDLYVLFQLSHVRTNGNQKKP
jgi:hypothetical protein